MVTRSIQSRLDRLEHQLETDAGGEKVFGRPNQPRLHIVVQSCANKEANHVEVRRYGFDPHSPEVRVSPIEIMIVSPDPQVPDRPLHPKPELVSVTDLTTKRQIWPT